MAHFYTWCPCMCEQPALMRWLLSRRVAPSKGNPLRRAAAIPVLRVGCKQGKCIATLQICLVGISSQTLKTQKAPGFDPELFSAARPSVALVFSVGAWSVGEKSSESWLAERDKTARGTAGGKEKISEAGTQPPRGFSYDALRAAHSRFAAWTCFYSKNVANGCYGRTESLLR